MLTLFVVVGGAAWALSANIAPNVVLFGAGVSFFAALALLPNRPRTVRVQGHMVYGLGAPLPVGDGYVVIKRVEWRTAYKGGTHDHVRFDVHYNGRVVATSEDPLEVRSFGEALARIVRVPIHWDEREPGIGVGTQQLLPVDAPLVDRMRELATTDESLSEPTDASVSVELDGTAVALESHLRPRVALMCLAVAVVAQVFTLKNGSGYQWIATLLWTLGVAYLPRAIVTRRLLVDDQGIALSRRLFGAVSFATRRIAAGDVDGLHLNDGELLVTGRGAWFARFAVGTSRWAADWARGIIASALAGDRKVAALSSPVETPAIAAIATRAQHTTHACPRCLARLADSAGAFDDALCAKCRGRFLSPSGAERLLEGELGITKEILRGILQSFAGKRLTCPGCGSQTSPARVRGVACDLCTGCGGVWLDSGELGALTQGRHQG